MAIKSQTLFIAAVTSLFQVRQTVADSFFQERLAEDIECLMENHIAYSKGANNLVLHEYVGAVKDLDKLLEEIIYLQKGSIVDLAMVREQVLSYLKELLNEFRTAKEHLLVVKTERIEVNVPSPVPNLTVRKPARTGQKILNETQKKILDFVRRVPECRTKEIMDEFSVLSGRTVKRGLKELSEEGLIVKKAENRAVYYSAV